VKEDQEASLQLFNMWRNIVIVALIAASAGALTEPQKIMTPQEKAKIQVACPDYSTYSKYALQ